MAVEIMGSPRISFSRDLMQTRSEHGNGKENDRLDESLPLDCSAASDFDFCIAGDVSGNEASTADELFSDGKILPLPINPRNPIRKISLVTDPNWVPPKSNISSTCATMIEKEDGRERLKEMIASRDDDEENEKPAVSPKTSFWRFGRSSSLNHRASFICSMTLLTRSKSQGCNPSPSPQQKQQRQASLRKNSSSKTTGKVSTSGSYSSSSSLSSSSSYYFGSSHSSHGSSSGVRISPVLNVPHPFLPKGNGGANGFFGFGHLLCSRKEKSNRKKPSSMFSAQLT